MTEIFNIVIPQQDCGPDRALETAIQHARWASKLANDSNPTARYHSAAAGAWAQIAGALYTRQTTDKPAGEGLF